MNRPFEQRPIEIGGHRITYGDLRTNAHAMLHLDRATGAERGLAAAVLALLDELEAKS